MPVSKSYASHMMNKRCARAIIDVDDPQSSSERRVCKVSYNEKYNNEIKTCLIKNSVCSKPSHAVVLMKVKFPEGVGSNDLPSDKQIKTKLSALKQAFK